MRDRHLLDALLHPMQAWRAFAARVDTCADAEARAAGLTVEVLPGGVRRYRDPRLDQLAAHRAIAQYVGVRTAAADELAEWSTPTLTTTSAAWSQ